MTSQTLSQSPSLPRHTAVGKIVPFMRVTIVWLLYASVGGATSGTTKPNTVVVQTKEVGRHTSYA